MLIEPATSFKEEQKQLRIARIKQSRRLANVAAKEIRDKVKFTKDNLLKAAEEEVLQQLVARQAAAIKKAAEEIEATYHNEVGKAYEEAAYVECDNVRSRTEKAKETVKREKAAVRRFENAKARLVAEQADYHKEEIYRRVAKQSALEKEAERTKTVISRPHPKQSQEIEKVAAELAETKRRPFRVLESNVYQATRYHLGIDVVENGLLPIQKNQIIDNCNDEDDSKPKTHPPQPSKKQDLVYPVVEQPKNEEEAHLAVPIEEVEDKITQEQKRRRELEMRAQKRGEVALKKERDSRQFEQLLSDLTSLQQVWRKHDVAVQPQVVGGRMYVGADRVEAEKRAQQSKLESAFNPIVRAVAASQEVPLGEEDSESLASSECTENPLTLSPKSSKTSDDFSESAVGSSSSLSSFRWQEVSCTSSEDQKEQENGQSTTVPEGTTTEANDTFSASSGVSEEDTTLASMSSPPPLEAQPISSDEVKKSKSEESTDKAEENLNSVTSSESMTLSMGSLSTMPKLGDVGPASVSSYDWLMEHNRLLMNKIEAHRRQIEEQRVALAHRLDQLNVKVESPLRRQPSSKLSETETTPSSVSTETLSAPSTLQQYKIQGDNLFSPALSSGSFLSDITPRRLPSFLSSSSSSNSSSSPLSTGPISAKSSITSTPLRQGSFSNKVSTLPPLHEETQPNPPKDFSLLMEKSSGDSSASSDASSSAVIAQQKFSQTPTTNPSSTSSSSSFSTLMMEFYENRGAAPSSKGADVAPSQPPVLPALSSTPRRAQVLEGSTDSCSEQLEPNPAFRSLILEGADDSVSSDGSSKSEDDFDLPPPSLVGDESFLNM